MLANFSMLVPFLQEIIKLLGMFPLHFTFVHYFAIFKVNIVGISWNSIIFFRFVVKNLQPGEAVVIIDYKMKLELGMRSREIQRDWYGKRGISLHGFYVIAQVAVGERRIDVLDLWCEDTKKDAWFTQSALDVGFAWMEKVFPNFQVYLFSGAYMYI